VDHEITIGWVGSMEEPEDGELNLRAEVAAKKAVKHAPRREKERIAARD